MKKGRLNAWKHYFGQPGVLRFHERPTGNNCVYAIEATYHECSSIIGTLWVRKEQKEVWGIADIYVRDCYRRCGIARRLLLQLIVLKKPSLITTDHGAKLFGEPWLKAMKFVPDETLGWVLRCRPTAERRQRRAK